MLDFAQSAALPDLLPLDETSRATGTGDNSNCLTYYLDSSAERRPETSRGGRDRLGEERRREMPGLTLSPENKRLLAPGPSIFILTDPLSA